MKKRQRNKILKQSGVKLHRDLKLTPLEYVTCSKAAESKMCSALSEFHAKEYDVGTIYGDGYFERLTNVMKSVVTIENVTGVKK